MRLKSVMEFQIRTNTGNRHIKTISVTAGITYIHAYLSGYMGFIRPFLCFRIPFFTVAHLLVNSIIISVKYNFYCKNSGNMVRIDGISKSISPSRQKRTKCLRHFNSPSPSFMRGIRGFLFIMFSFIIVLWIYYKRFLLTILKKWFISNTLVTLSSRMY